MDKDKYIIVVTMCNKKEIANTICRTLVNKKLVVGCQIYNADSIYRWKDNIDIEKEYRIEFRTKLSKYEEVEKEIRALHDYEVCEISAYEIVCGSKDFLNWIDNNLCE